MSIKILLVDDDIDYVAITKSQLCKGGFNVEVAYNGEECLEKVKKDRPDLIVLDVMMPVLNGYDVCEILKSDENTKGIPVILLTAVAENVTKTNYTRRQGVENEADDYIKKPPVYDDLIKSINNLI